MFRISGSIRITPRVPGLSVYGSYSCVPDLARRHRSRVSDLLPLPNQSAEHLILSESLDGEAGATLSCAPSAKILTLRAVSLLFPAPMILEVWFPQ